jgi:uncharacterized protein YlxW (UPF0749 family)
MVRARDLAILVNGLWRAGAEAIAVNGIRLTARSALRNSGEAINLDGPPLSPPYVVSAIGDNRTLQANLLDNPSGQEFVSRANVFGFRVRRHNADRLSLPAADPAELTLRNARAGTGRKGSGP